MAPRKENAVKNQKHVVENERSIEPSSQDQTEMSQTNVVMGHGQYIVFMKSRALRILATTTKYVHLWDERPPDSRVATGALSFPQAFEGCKGASDKRTILVRLRIPILDRGAAQILGSQWWAGRGAGCTQGRVLGLVVLVFHSTHCAPHCLCLRLKEAGFDWWTCPKIVL